jgi:hypothetical protein
MRLWKLKFAIVLPIVQAVVAVSLLQKGYQLRSALGPHPSPFYIPTITHICYGISAPAVFLRFVTLLPRVNLHSIGNFDSGDLLFLSGVILVWYLVGRAIDNRSLGSTVKSLGKRFVAEFFLMMLGVALLCFSIGGALSDSTENMKGATVQIGLSVLWGCCLTLFSGIRIAAAVRSRTIVAKSEHS